MSLRYVSPFKDRPKDDAGRVKFTSEAMGIEVVLVQRGVASQDPHRFSG